MANTVVTSLRVAGAPSELKELIAGDHGPYGDDPYDRRRFPTFVHEALSMNCSTSAVADGRVGFQYETRGPQVEPIVKLSEKYPTLLFDIRLFDWMGCTFALYVFLNGREMQRLERSGVDIFIETEDSDAGRELVPELAKLWDPWGTRSLMQSSN